MGDLKLDQKSIDAIRINLETFNSKKKSINNQLISYIY